MNRIYRLKILPAVVISDSRRAVALGRAILAGGLNVMEVTFRHPDAPRCIELIRKELPEIYIGAGTILKESQLRQALDAGAQFGVTPGFNPTIVNAARNSQFPMIPGVLTPGEMEQALEMGCSTVKFFPAAAGGGVSYLQAIAGPYAHTGLRIIPLGGIGPQNMRDYLALPMVAAIGGSWMAAPKLIESEDYDQITKLVHQAVMIANETGSEKPSPT
jgi:2-dehydro-3-deoxyphosphogluconate aldolase/(4S)-4-hydroxy-2-oxoglutarate aldolase